jgi:hypothetical protein
LCSKCVKQELGHGHVFDNVPLRRNSQDKINCKEKKDCYNCASLLNWAVVRGQLRSLLSVQHQRFVLQIHQKGPVTLTTANTSTCAQSVESTDMHPNSLPTHAKVKVLNQSLAVTGRAVGLILLACWWPGGS